MDNIATMLQDILSEKQLNSIISQNSKTGSQLVKYELKPATEDMSGFIGDHFQLTLHLKEGDLVKKMHLFVKTLPFDNAPKSQFINENKLFGRESLTFEIFEHFHQEEFSDSNPWGVKALLHNDSILVLPDLSVKGYKTYPVTQYLDLEHALVAVKSLARFHAAFAKHQTKVSEANSNSDLPEEYSVYIEDHIFCNSICVGAAIETTTNFLKEFSSNIKQYPVDLEDSMTRWCIDACDKIKEYENTLNVIIHKDLWANNILFKYSGAEPVNAVLIDFQCARYAPPAIDVMVFLYYNTSRKFRENYEKAVLDHYYSVFSESIDELTKHRLGKLNYNHQAFLDLCEKLRPAGMIVPLAVSPFTVMSPQVAQKSFDNEQTFYEHFFTNRCSAVVGYARQKEYYKTRMLELFEEFVERQILK